MKSPFEHDGSSHYHGGKGLAFRQIINLMPPHRRYVETHLGGGAVMRHKRAADATVGIDRDPRVIEMWRRRGVPPDTEMVCGDANKILTTLEIGGDDLIYCDPPYPRRCRRSGRPYRFEMDDQDHVNLLETLRRLPAKVMVSSYENDIYRDALGDWHRHTYRTATHNGAVTECVWTNFDPGSELHDYRYLGNDFREREQIRRRCQGLLKRLQSLETVELNAVLAELAVSKPTALDAAVRRRG